MATKFQWLSLLLSLLLMDMISSSDSILCEPSTNCIINCLNNNCVGQTLICPTNQPCDINCHTKHSCLNTTIIANQSSRLHIYTLSSYAASHSNIYCPSSSFSDCQIYGDTLSQHQWHKLNLHIKSHNHYKFICKSTICAIDATISLFSHSNHRHTSCKLSNITYECIHYARKLLSINTTTSSADHDKAKGSTTDHNPFGIQLSTAQLSNLLFASALLLISLFCVVICLLICMWKQRRQQHNNKMVKDSHNLTDKQHENHSFKYLILSYQDGRKLKLPIDLSSLQSLNPHNNNHNTDTHSSHRNFISESLHAALDIDHNKIISVDIIDTNPDEDEESQNTVIPSLHIDHEHSPIDIVLEDMDSTALRLPPSNLQLHSTLIKVGNNSQNQHIVQNSVTMTNSMELMHKLKQYKMRKDSDLTGDKENESSHSWSNEAESEPDSYSEETEEGSDDGETLRLKKNKRIHHQSSSHPQILVANKAHKQHKKAPKRPKTAHPTKSKDLANSFSAWTKVKKVHKSSNKERKSPQNSSLESEENNDNRVRFHTLMLQNDVIPSMQISSSAPTHPKIRMRSQPPITTMMLPDHQHMDNLTPSKKGLRRSPLTLPKPAANKRNYFNSQPPNILKHNPPNVYQNAAAMQYQMAMYHQRHQRILQPNHNRMERERHNSEPSNAYKTTTAKDGFYIADMAPLKLKDDATDHSNRTRSKSHPSEPPKTNSNGKIWDNEHAGFILNDELYDSASHEDNNNKHKKSKHDKKLKARHAKISKKHRTKDVNPFSRSTETLQIPIYVTNGKKHKIKHRIKYYANHNRLETEHSATTNNTHYTETTISDTPIPLELNPDPIAMLPINTQLQYKTTTISSAFIPPPPSPQLTQTKHYTLSPPNSLKTLDTNTTNAATTTQRGISQQTTATISTVTTRTFDGGAAAVKDTTHDTDTESSSGLSQDTANSNANNRMRSNNTEETVTYKKSPYSLNMVQAPINNENGSDETLSSQATDSNSTHHHFSQHYITNSNDSADKMMYIPPVPMHDVYSRRRLKPLADNNGSGSIVSYNYSRISTLSKLPQYKNDDEEEEDNESHNDEEKAMNPSYGHNNPYLTEPNNDTLNMSKRGSSSTQPPTFPNHTSASTHPPTFPSRCTSSANSNNHHLYFTHALDETMQTLTVSQSDHDDDEENIWHNQKHANNNDYVE